MVHMPHCMLVVNTSSRLDQSAIEDPNGPPSNPYPIPDVKARLGGPTAPRMGGGMIPPQNSGVVLSSRAPESFAPHDDLTDAHSAQQPMATDRREMFQDPRAHVVSGNRR